MAKDMSSGISPEEHHHKHGSLGGHVLPGSFFLIWALWWFVNISSMYIHGAQRRKAFTSRPFYKIARGSIIALEPASKILLPFIGILGELYFSHGHWRSLYQTDGRFESNHLNNWQHALMFAAFMVSGAVDLLGMRMQLPPGTEQAFLGLAFLAEGTLLSFHLKGNDVEFLVHLLLTLTIFLCVFVVFLELVLPSSPLCAFSRCFAVFLQGSWWCQTGRILFLSDPAWHADYMGSTMFLPVLFVFHSLCIAVLMLAVYLLVAYKYASKDVAQRGFELVERANDTQTVKMALLDLTKKQSAGNSRSETWQDHDRSSL